MKRLGLILILSIVIAPAWAAKFEKGKHYVEIPFSEELDTGNKVEVREFFWYGCGHCYKFEPMLDQWLKNKPSAALFVRTPAFPRKVVHANSYHAFEAMGIVDKIHRKFFDALHVDGKRLDTVDAVADFVAANGFDKGEFRKKYKSFAVDHKTRKGFQLGTSYGVKSVPVIVVDGRYKFSASTVGNNKRVIELMDYLVKKIAKEKR
ncbi:MAG: thiol:disulfide interchange protein DsbA/DsbL [Proteobacteria bacterium]|nr:thiol:disulfide interchange protein DsbA/DsbL [Pseudomonadota bacterium]